MTQGLFLLICLKEKRCFKIKIKIVKKGKWRCSIALLLCLLMLVSCNTAGGKTEESTQAPDEPFDNGLVLIADAQAYCGIVRPKDGGERIEDLCTDLSKAIRQCTGVNVKRYTDGGETPEGTIEILIGDTNRPESAQAKEKLVGFEYSVSVINGKVVVAGSDEVMLEYAVDHLLGLFQGIPANGILTVAKDYDQKLDGSNYQHNAYLGRGLELTSEYTLLSKLSPFGASTSDGKTTLAVVQGGCTDGTYYYCFMVTNDSESQQDERKRRCVILKYDLATQNLVKVSAEMNLHHANDAAYNPNNNTILLSGIGTFFVIDPETLTVIKTVSIPPNAGSVAYNAEQRMYITADRSYFYFYDENYELVKQLAITNLFTDYGEASQYQATQGMTCDDKYIYYMEYWMGAAGGRSDIRCQITVYDLQTGAFVEKIPLQMGREVENIIVWNNSFYIICNNITWTGAECYRVKVYSK